MGLFIQQNDKRTKLQERLAAELREKAKAGASGAEPMDQTKRSNYLKDTETASRTGLLWLLLAVTIIAAVLFYLVMM